MLFYARDRFSTSPQRQNASLIIVLEKLCFYHNVSGMCWIDLSHKITLRTMILEEKSKIFIFSLQYTLLFPWIRAREAFSSSGNARNRFPAWNYPQKYDFEGEISKFFDFRFNTHIYFPESGSRKRFQGSGMRAIDFSQKITPRRSLVKKIFYPALSWTPPLSE